MKPIDVAEMCGGLQPLSELTKIIRDSLARARRALFLAADLGAGVTRVTIDGGRSVLWLDAAPAFAGDLVERRTTTINALGVAGGRRIVMARWNEVDLAWTESARSH